VRDWTCTCQHKRHRRGRSGLPLNRSRKGAAAVLSSRIQAQGEIAVEETVADRAARLKRVQEFNQQKDEFRRSYEGVGAATAAWNRLFADLKANADVVKTIGGRIQEVTGGFLMVVGNGVVMVLRYHSRYANSLDEAYLTVAFYDGVPRLPGLRVWDDPQTLMNWKFQFALIGPGRSGWVGPGLEEHAPEAMAEFLLKEFMDMQQKQLGRR
jgi:hypothetical protein